MTRLLLGGAAALLVLLALPGVLALRPDGGHLLRAPGTASLLTSDVSLVAWSWAVAGASLLVLLAAAGWGGMLRRLLRLPDAGALGLLAGIPAGVAALSTGFMALGTIGLPPAWAAAATTALGLALIGGGTRRLEIGSLAAVGVLLPLALAWGFQAGRVHVAGDAAALWGPLSEALARGELPRFGTWADEGLAVGMATLLAGAPEAWGQALWILAASARAALAATVWLVLRALAPQAPRWAVLAVSLWAVAGSQVVWPIQGQGFFSGGSPGWQAMHTGKVLLLQVVLLAALPRWRAPVLGLALTGALLASGYPEAAIALGAAALAVRLRGQSPAWSWTLAALLLAGGVLLRLPGAIVGAGALLIPLLPALARLPISAWAGLGAAALAGLGTALTLGFLGGADPLGAALLAEARPGLFGPDGPTALVDLGRPWPWASETPGPPGLSRLDLLRPLALPLTLALAAVWCDPRRGARLAVLAAGALAAGTRQEGARADLTRAYAEIVARLRPRWVVMENVPQVRASASYQAAREILKAAGYGLTERVLDASRCGVPQARKRFFAIGRLGGEDGELDAAIDAALSPTPLGLRAYLGAEAASWPEAYYRHPRTYGRRAIYTLDEPSATIRGVNRPRPKTYGTVKPAYHKQDAVKADHVQALTSDQRARIQTFPQGWDWCRDVLAKTDVEQAIGNAVPVELGRFVGRIIMANDTALL